MANGYGDYINKQFKVDKKPRVYKTTGSQYNKTEVKERAAIRSQLANDVAYWQQKRGVTDNREKNHVAIAEQYYKTQEVREARDKAGQKRMSANKGKGKYSAEDRLQESKEYRDKDRKTSAKAYQKEIGEFATSDFIKKYDNYSSKKGITESDVRFESYMDKQKGKKNTVAQQLVPEFAPKKKKEKSFLDKIFDVGDKGKDQKSTSLNLSIRDGGSPTGKSKGKNEKGKGNILKDFVNVSAGAMKSVNPFDDETFGDSLMKNAMKFDKKKSTQFDEFSRGAGRTTNTASLGLMGNLDKNMRDGKTPEYLSKRKFGEGGGADVFSDLLGYAVPGAALARGLKGTKLGADTALKALSKGGALTRAKEGAAIGAAMAGVEIGGNEALNPDDHTWKENLARLGIETAGGAIADPLLSAGGALIGAGGKKLLNKLKQPPKNKLKLDDIDSSEVPFTVDEPKNRLETLLPAVSQTAATSTKPRYDVDVLMKAYKGQDVSNVAMKPSPKKVANVLKDPQLQESGDISTFRKKVNHTPVKNKNGLLSNLRTQFVDDAASLETLERKITGKLNSAEDSVYKQARLFKGSPEKAHLIVKEELYPILKDLQDTGSNYKDLGDYALAIHAIDVNNQGINSGFTYAEAKDVIAKLGSENMELARKKLLGVNNKILDMLRDGGIIDNTQVAAMREKYPNYVSLFRSFDDDKVDFVGGLGRTLTNASSPIKKLEGSNREVIDPMESVIKNIFKATNAIDRNKVGKQIASLAEKDKGGTLVRRLDPDEDVGRLNVVSVLENGVKAKFEVPPEVYRTLTNMDKESSNTLIKILQKPASLLRAGATLTPEFSLRNPLRDVPNAFVVSSSGFNPLVDFPIGLWQSIWKGRTIKIGNKEFKTAGEIYKQFIKENGGYGNIISMDRKLHQETLKKALTDVNSNYVDVLDPKTYSGLIKKFSNPINTLRTIADVSETATKVGEYRAAIRSGTTPEEAAYRARDIMDFARAGVSVREANKVVAFLNANIQGKSKLWRAFKENPTKVTGKAVAAVTIPTIGAIVAQNTYANDKQKEIIDDAPRWMKDTFWLVPVPGSNQIARIPKPFDLAFAFANTLERAVEYAYKNDKDAFDGWLKQGFSQASVPVMLTGIAPIIEGMADYSFFRQAPIIPLREKGLEYPDQYDVNTTETAKFIGNQVNKATGGVGAFKNFGSPRVIDNTIKGFTGGLGTYGTSVVDMFAKGGEDEPARPSKSIDQMPLARAFLVNQSGSGDSLEKLYTMKDKLTKARGSAKRNEVPFVDEHKYQAVNDITKDIGELNKRIRSVENDLIMTPQQKKKMLDGLTEHRNMLSRQGMEKIKNME